jgi:hypothetical protein
LDPALTGGKGVRAEWARLVRSAAHSGGVLLQPSALRVKLPLTPETHFDIST